MELGERIVESDTVFCTWHGIKETNVYLDSNSLQYGIAQNGVVVAIKNTLSEIAKLYVEMTWGNKVEQTERERLGNLFASDKPLSELVIEDRGPS